MIVYYNLLEADLRHTSLLSFISSVTPLLHYLLVILEYSMTLTIATMICLGE